MTDAEVLLRLRDMVSAIDALPPGNPAHKQLGELTGVVCDAFRKMRELGETASCREDAAVEQLESAAKTALDLQLVGQVMQS